MTMGYNRQFSSSLNRITMRLQNKKASIIHILSLSRTETALPVTAAYSLAGILSTSLLRLAANQSQSINLILMVELKPSRKYN